MRSGPRGANGLRAARVVRKESVLGNEIAWSCTVQQATRVLEMIPTVKVATLELVLCTVAGRHGNPGVIAAKRADSASKQDTGDVPILIRNMVETTARVLKLKLSSA